MISYKWGLPGNVNIFLEKDPVPLSGYEETYQLRYKDGKRDDVVLDYNFRLSEIFEYKIVCESLKHYNIPPINSDLIDKIINEANALVELGRNG